jgi:hypothetical protein
VLADFAVPRLKAHFSRLASDAAKQQRGIELPRGKCLPKRVLQVT